MSILASTRGNGLHVDIRDFLVTMKTELMPTFDPKIHHKLFVLLEKESIVRLKDYSALFTTYQLSPSLPLSLPLSLPPSHSPTPLQAKVVPPWVEEHPDVFNDPNFSITKLDTTASELSETTGSAMEISVNPSLQASSL